MSPERALAEARRRQEAGDLAGAEAMFRQVLESTPDHGGALYALATLACRQGRFDEGGTLAARLVAAHPNVPEGQFLYGFTLRTANRTEAAVAAYRRAIALRPDYAEAHNNLGNALWELRRLEAAETAFRETLRLTPNDLNARCNLGNVLRDQGRLGEAEEAYRAVLAHAPRDARYVSNLANVLTAQGRHREAEAEYRRAIAIEPDNPFIHADLGQLMIVTGRLAEGWPEWEWRTRQPDFAPARRAGGRPMWQGEDVAGRTVLIIGEQGYGDSIQFIRYAPLLASRGARVIVECRAALTRLFEGVEGVVRVIEKDAPLPPFDFWCSAMSLPARFGTTLETVPADIPYLAVDPAAGAAWRERLADAKGLKVGLVWAGSPTHKNDLNRSMDPALLAPLPTVPGVAFFSLQFAAPADDLAALGNGSVRDVAADLTDFAEAAAALAALDLLISVDTAPAHLAGALGRPVWMMVPFTPDWRWTVGRDDSPWYPTMRLFRQPSWGDWPAVVEGVRVALMEHTSGVRP